MPEGHEAAACGGHFLSRLVCGCGTLIIRGATFAWHSPPRLQNLALSFPSLGLHLVRAYLSLSVLCLLSLATVSPLRGNDEAADKASSETEEIKQKNVNFDFFERKIRPVLVEHCYACHSSEGKQIEGGLRVDSREALRRGGESGPAVLPEQTTKSLLLAALKYESLEMPPDRRLPTEVIENFETWIAQGAHDPRDESAAEVEEVKSAIDYDQGRKFWSFQRPIQHELPQHHFQDWSQSRIDHFVAAELEQHQLSPAPPAERPVLLRRLAYDLTGLPPTPAQLARWNSISPDVLVDRVTQELLDTTAFGEHWARMWLDLMRYADDQAHIVGNDQSLCFPNSHLYRQWVITALNLDLPYDRFIELQLAADIVTPDDREDDVALGFMGLGPKYYRRNSPEVQAEEWEDRVDVLSRGLLGLTVACARCHDHKYDPIGTADYYALAGVFASVEMFNRPLDAERETNDKGHAKEPKDALHIIRDVEARDLSIMVRGDVNRLGPVVPRGFLTVLTSSVRQEYRHGSGRAELAHEIVSRENPLTARVLVNRVWGHLIGKPLVGTPSNFGSLGERPTHPKLLDDLAVRFMDNGWSLKWLCHEIVTSATYQQSSSREPTKLDPQNQWLSRMHRKRLSVEQWRDGILLACGRLQQEAAQANIDPGDPQASHRTIYSAASRLKLNPMLALFDYPDPNTHSDGRVRTTSASQKLFLMNSPFMVEHARAMAESLREHSSSVGEAVDETYQRLLARPPSPDELLAAVEYLRIDGGNLDQYAHAVMMSNEMFFVD